MRLHVIASGSKGNAAIVENTLTGESVLLDCGITKKAFFAGCESVGFDPSGLRAVLVTHEHSDHTKGLGVVMRGLAKAGVHPALFVNEPTFWASADIQALDVAMDVRMMRQEDDLSLAGMDVHVFPTSHDAAAPCGFRFDVAGDALGFMSDAGMVTGYAHEALSSVRVLALESNHDVRMLETGPYPYVIKRRVGSEVGHLSNDQAAEELSCLLSDSLEEVVALHISENNNTYQLPPAALGSIVERAGASVHVRSAYQHRPITV